MVNINEKDFYTTAELAELLGVSRIAVFKRIKSGSIKATKVGRNFVIFKKDVGEFEALLSELFTSAKAWALSGRQFSEKWYCQTSAVFQARLVKMENFLLKGKYKNKLFSLLTSIAGEIGNNSFDHNLGQWPDTPGIFFGYDLLKRHVVLADRGVGVLQTLQRVKPALRTHADALKVAFTEIISGRDPEARGNGLKYVRSVIAKYPIRLLFQTGDATLVLRGESEELPITKRTEYIRGCLAFITY